MSTLKVGTLQNASGVEVYTAKAWVNFNGTGTVAIRASGNVSSITDNGVGDYTVNFTNAMADENYVLAGSASYGSSAASGRYMGAYPISTAYQTTSIRIATTYDYNMFEDENMVNVAIFR